MSEENITTLRAGHPERRGHSFYFFDIDDNILFLTTKIIVRNTETMEEKELSTGEFAEAKLGEPGKWEDYALIKGPDGSFRNFNDIPAGQLKPGQEQHFVVDVEKAASSDNTDWQGPSWRLFVYACKAQRPVSLVTARGHSPETLKAGVRKLVEMGALPQEPNYHSVYPVGNTDVRRNELNDPDLEMTTPALKKRAIIKTVRRAAEEFGDEPHRFGMSDDDPKNVDLVIRAMVECKKEFRGMRFFAINTHAHEMVKLEVFPVDFAVT